MCFYYKSTERKPSRYCRTPQTRYLDTCTAYLSFTFRLNRSLRHKAQQRKDLNSSAFAGDQVLEWNGKLLQGATFKEVYNIILESKPEPQVELVVSRPLGWEGTLDRTLLLHPHAVGSTFISPFWGTWTTQLTPVPRPLFLIMDHISHFTWKGCSQKNRWSGSFLVPYSLGC